MASACPFVCARAKLRSLPSPLGAISPSAKARTGGSADLMDFYATTYAVAYGQPCFRPRLGHHIGTGYVSNSAVPCLLCLHSAAAGHRQDNTASTATEHFKPLWLPDGRSLLPRHVHQPGSGYLQESSPSCLRTGAASPQHARLLRGPPKTSGAESRRTGPAQPDILQKTTIGTKEQSGFTRSTLRTDGVLPAQPGQPLGVSITTTDYLPSLRSHGGETLPVLPAGSERSSGFSREVPGYLGTAVSQDPIPLPGPNVPSSSSPAVPTQGLPTRDHPVLLVSRGLQAPRAPQASLLGQWAAGRKEPSGFTTNHGQYVPPRLTPPAPARCWRDPTWTARPMGGIQPRRPSGFGTNNHPTGLGGPSPATPRHSPPTPPG